MTIVLNEYKWVQSAISENRMIGDTYETMLRLAMYYRFIGYADEDVRREIECFLKRCDSNISIVKWEGFLDRIMKDSLRRPLLIENSIPITDKELLTIDGLKGAQIKRLAFTLLCIAKYYKLINPNGDYWVNSKDSDIMRMANINTSIKRQSGLYKDLKELGLIQFSSRVDNTNIKVCFVEDGNTDMVISSYENLGYQYMRYIGDDHYMQCSCCGIVVRKNNANKKTLVGRPQKYCKECAAHIKIQQSVNPIFRYAANPT